MGSAWKKQMSVGNAIIDSEHRNLIATASNIESMIRAGDISAISQELEEFEHWLYIHFRNEEEIARAVNFDFAQNRLEHQSLLREFRRMKDELMPHGNVLPDSAAKRYSHFLSDWLAGHIAEEDMKMKPVLQAYPYDFMPDHKVE